jgi:putative FmdB family regulatory protein
MPTYSYRCTECGTAFDIQQAFTDDSLTVCMNCGGKLRKLFHAVGVSFSGSGFYRNDSRAGENTAREKKENADAAPAAASGAPAKEAASAASVASATPAAAPASGTSKTPTKKPAAAKTE